MECRYPRSIERGFAYALYRWKANIRAAAVPGVAGAGGLGQRIHIAIRLQQAESLGESGMTCSEQRALEAAERRRDKP